MNNNWNALLGEKVGPRKTAKRNDKERKTQVTKKNRENWEKK